MRDPRTGALLVLALGVALPQTAPAVEVPFGPPNLIVSVAGDLAIHGVEAADLDGDGSVDVAATMHFTVFPPSGSARLGWFPNSDGQGTFGAENAIGAAAFQIRAAQVDGDADVDVLTTNLFNTLAWWDNTAGDGSAWTQRSVGAGFSAVHALDFDGDLDTDVVSAGSQVLWHESNGGVPPGFTSRTVSPSDNWHDAIGVDLDGDEDMDVLAVTGGSTSGGVPPTVLPSRLVWYESDGATPPVFTERAIDTADFCSSNQGNPPCNRVYAADLDGDDDVDPVFWDEQGDLIVWYENDGSQPPAFTARTVSASARGGLPADIDRDGDLDLVGSYLTDLVWFENDGASPPGWTPREIGPLLDLLDLEAADFDADGDLDVVASATTSLFWFENQLPAPGVPALPVPALLLLSALLLALGASALRRRAQSPARQPISSWAKRTITVFTPARSKRMRTF